MMNVLKQSFGALSEPWIRITGMNESDLTNLILRNADDDPRFVVRLCRGRKMTTTQGIYDEFAAALQFPYYFGENWPALDECIADLEWLPADGYLICITSAQEIGANDSYDSFATLMRILVKAGRGWAGENPDLQNFGIAPRPFHVLLQVPESRHQTIIERLSSLELNADVFQP